MIFLLTLFFLQAHAAPNISAYQAAEIGNNILVNSPFGTRVFFGDIGLKEYPNYKIEIPLADLRAKAPSPDNNNPDDATGNGKPQSPETLQAEESAIILAANELYNQGKFMDALKYVDEVLKRNKASTRAWIMKGSLLHIMGEKDSAKKSWEEGQKLDPNNKEIQNILENYK